MDILLNLDPVTSSYNLRGLRRLFNLVESNVRGLRSLEVPPKSSFLVSINEQTPPKISFVSES